VFDGSLPLASMFAIEPPSSSDPTKRLRRRRSSVLDAFRQLLLQIGGANIAGVDHAFVAAIRRRQKPVQI